MTPRYTESATGRRDRWMVSYVDVLTILLIFFLVAATRNLKIPAAQAVLLAATPAVTPAKAKPPRTNLIAAQERLRQSGLDARLESRGLVISLPQVILFPSGEDAVSPMALPAIARIAEVLRDLPNDVRLIGHADQIPIHNRRFRTNWDLSIARSRKILDLLTNSYGISEWRLSIASYGPYRPAAPNNTVDGRTLNRRVEIVIMDDSHATGEPA